jgi:tryptophan synthase alpha chain
LVVGFGISDPAQAGEVAAVADGVVVGSALVKQFERYRGADLLSQAGSFVKALKDGIRKGRGR